MAALVGDSMQTPPAYSAVKVGGRKLYEAARKGEHLEAAARPIHVEVFELLRYRDHEASFRVRCGGGTYACACWPPTWARRSAAARISRPFGVRPWGRST